MIVVPKDQRKAIVDAAYEAVALDVLPLQFCHKTRGILEFAKALIRLFQSYPLTVEINVEKLLQAGDTVRKGIIDRSLEIQKINLEIPSIIEMEGGVPCDVVKIEANGRKYYGFVIDYLPLSRHSVVQGGGIS